MFIGSLPQGRSPVFEELAAEIGASFLFCGMCRQHLLQGMHRPDSARASHEQGAELSSELFNSLRNTGLSLVMSFTLFAVRSAGETSTHKPVL